MKQISFFSKLICVVDVYFNFLFIYLFIYFIFLLLFFVSVYLNMKYGTTDSLFSYAYAMFVLMFPCLFCNSLMLPCHIVSMEMLP